MTKPAPSVNGTGIVENSGVRTISFTVFTKLKGGDKSYREALESSSKFNKELDKDRKLRLPFLESQTRVAQTPSVVSCLSSYQRQQSKIPGQVIAYPIKRWCKKKRYLTEANDTSLLFQQSHHVYLQHRINARNMASSHHMDEIPNPMGESFATHHYHHHHPTGVSSHHGQHHHHSHHHPAHSMYPNGSSSPALTQQQPHIQLQQQQRFMQTPNPQAYPGHHHPPAAQFAMPHQNGHPYHPAYPQSTSQAPAPGMPIKPPHAGNPASSNGNTAAQNPSNSNNNHDDDWYMHDEPDDDNDSGDEDFDDPGSRKKKKKSNTAKKKRGNDSTVGNDDKQFVCERCGMKYKTKPGLNYHMKNVNCSASSGFQPGNSASISLMSQNSNSSQAMPMSGAPMGGGSHHATSGRAHDPNDENTTNSVFESAYDEQNSSSSFPPLKHSISNGLQAAASMQPSDLKTKCGTCFLAEHDSSVNPKNEKFVMCSECHRHFHPPCLTFPASMIELIRKYNWQCVDCKKCTHCGTSENDDKLLFCDECDRGYHMYCLKPPMSETPAGEWACELCVKK